MRNELELAFMVHERAYSTAEQSMRTYLDRMLIYACVNSRNLRKALDAVDGIIKRENVDKVCNKHTTICSVQKTNKTLSSGPQVI